MPPAVKWVYVFVCLTACLACLVLAALLFTARGARWAANRKAATEQARANAKAISRAYGLYSLFGAAVFFFLAAGLWLPGRMWSPLLVIVSLYANHKFNDYVLRKEGRR